MKNIILSILLFLLGVTLSLYVQNDYYMRQARSYLRNAEYALRKAKYVRPNLTKTKAEGIEWKRKILQKWLNPSQVPSIPAIVASHFLNLTITDAFVRFHFGKPDNLH